MRRHSEVTGKKYGNIQDTFYRNSMFYGSLISGALAYEAEKLTATFCFKLLNVVHFVA